ncbi:MAG TPA: hypothetical protein VE010_12230, partial [Thermoanaerobaculia bacterium]|nr:hypothetical protein [Thermoanaerobaculia bacterium]
ITLAPVFIAGTFLAALLLPNAQQQFVDHLQLFAVPAAELLLLVALVRRVARLKRERSTDADPYVRIFTAARSLIGEGRAAEVVASELAMFYYALFCWRKKPEEVNGRAFTLHERSGWSTVLAGIILLVVAESIGMHLLLAMWSPVAAWLWTAMDVWAIVWLMGDYHALRLRRSWVDGEALHLNYGLRWSVSIPLDAIASVEEVRVESEWKRKDVLKVAMLEEPRWLIAFDQPLVARGMAGFRKEIRGIALLPDDDDAITFLRTACARRCSHD